MPRDRSGVHSSLRTRLQRPEDKHHRRGDEGPESGLGHEERLPATRLSAGSGFRKETIGGMRRNGRDALIPDVRATLIGPLGSTRSGPFGINPENVA
jgi:hypothetical protein